MYCVKCRRVTATEDIIIATSKNNQLMRRGQCFICKTKLRLNLLKKELLMEVS